MRYEFIWLWYTPKSDSFSRFLVSSVSQLGNTKSYLTEDKDPLTKKKYWYTSPESHKVSRMLIPKKFKDYFCNKTITISAMVNSQVTYWMLTTAIVGEYDCITPIQEREVFQRVQLGVPLKMARKSYHRLAFRQLS